MQNKNGKLEEAVKVLKSELEKVKLQHDEEAKEMQKQIKDLNIMLKLSDDEKQQNY